MTYTATRRVEASARTFAIVEHLGHVGRRRITPLARELEMSKGIVHNHVSTLRELGYVTKVGDYYELSSQFVHLGCRVQRQSALYRAAHSLLAAYANRVEAGVVCVQRAGDKAAVTDSHRLPSSVGLSVGTTQPLARLLPGVVLQLRTAAVSAAEPASVDGETREASSTAHGHDIEQLTAQLDERGWVTGPLAADSSTDCLAFSVANSDGAVHGSVGIVLPDTQDDQHRQSIEESVPALRQRIETRIQRDTAGERSFATEKHAWIDG